ncbi:MAG: hypothetical protein ACXWQQ_15790 [Pseudobdellovibrio sp.]
MKSILSLVTAFVLLASSSVFASTLACKGGGESFTISVTSDKIEVSNGDGPLSREKQDPDCAYRSNRFACYEDGQLMINIPLMLAAGKAEKGTVYIQSDTGDNADSHNHALLGVPYSCVLQ